ncbi:MAG: bifunctional riboflavin kinase/FAD synthetase [Prevotella sp.]|nr:bifunctional riboflavin kinase/FAD synthetase [Prevotella sp.]
MKTTNLREGMRLEGGCVATLGCFDGVHRGHQLLISMVLRKAEEMGQPSVVITFDRQPRELFDPDYRPQLLSTLEEKEQLIAALGVNHLVVLPFTKELASLTAQAFIQQVLHEQLGAQVLVTGYDNRFGRNRAEGFDDYVRYGKMLGMEVLRGDEAMFPGTDEAVSSSAIRQLLLEGKVERMQESLTRLYSLTGRVVSGEHIGHEIGFPTANLAVDNPYKIIPAPGVYAVWAILDTVRMPAMMNIGTRPTFDGTTQTLEVHILDQVGDVYGQVLTVEFVSRLRSERRFDSPEALVEQLKADKAEAMERLVNSK